MYTYMKAVTEAVAYGGVLILQSDQYINYKLSY